MGQSDPPGQRDARMVGINLPGVQIKHDRQSLSLNLPHGPASQPVRVNAEVRPPRNRDVSAQHPYGRRGELDQVLAPCGQAVRPAGGIGNAIAVVLYRKDAGVVVKANLSEYVQGPERFASDGEKWCPVAENALARHILQDMKRANQLLAEHLRGLLVDRGVRVAVSPDLVAGRGDLPDKPWVLLGNLAQDEKRCPDPRLRQQVEKTPSDGADPILEAFPLGGWDLQTLIPVFKINGQSVDASRSHGVPARRCA
jgi:hypothetical protein